MYYKLLSALALGFFIALMAPVAKQADNFNKCVADGNETGKLRVRSSTWIRGTSLLITAMEEVISPYAN